MKRTKQQLRSAREFSARKIVDIINDRNLANVKANWISCRNGTVIVSVYRRGIVEQFEIVGNDKKRHNTLCIIDSFASA
jgi:hypothetical protein